MAKRKLDAAMDRKDGRKAKLTSEQVKVSTSTGNVTVKAKARTQQDSNRFKWVITEHKYFRTRCTPGNGPPFVIEAGERWLDCGAHVGYFALLAIAHGASAVTCVEACAENFALLKANTAKPRLPRAGVVKCIRALVAAKASKVPGKLLLSRKSTRHSSLAVPEGKRHDGQFQKVPRVVTLPLLLKSGAYEALKMNIEGAEVPVLQSMKIWPSCLKKLVVEYSLDVFPKYGDYLTFISSLKKQGWTVHAEPVPKWFVESRIWDTKRTLGNNARQVWAFR